MNNRAPLYACDGSCGQCYSTDDLFVYKDQWICESCLQDGDDLIDWDALDRPDDPLAKSADLLAKVREGCRSIMVVTDGNQLEPRVLGITLNMPPELVRELAEALTKEKS